MLYLRCTMSIRVQLERNEQHKKLIEKSWKYYNDRALRRFSFSKNYVFHVPDRITRSFFSENYVLAKVNRSSTNWMANIRHYNSRHWTQMTITKCKNVCNLTIPPPFVIPKTPIRGTPRIPISRNCPNTVVSTSKLQANENCSAKLSSSEYRLVKPASSIPFERNQGEGLASRGWKGYVPEKARGYGYVRKLIEGPEIVFGISMNMNFVYCVDSNPESGSYSKTEKERILSARENRKDEYICVYTYARVQGSSSKLLKKCLKRTSFCFLSNLWQTLCHYFFQI